MMISGKDIFTMAGCMTIMWPNNFYLPQMAIFVLHILKKNNDYL